MLKAVVRTETPVAANTDIPFSPVFNTNDSTSFTATGTGRIRKAGFYDVDATLTVTDVPAGSITASFYSDDIELTDVSVTGTSTGTTDNIILPLRDVVRALWSQINDAATISVRLDGAATVVEGSLFTIEKRK